MKLTEIRKKTEGRLENMRFQRSVRLARHRQTLRTEHAVLHNMVYQQISPQLRERVLARGRHVEAMLNMS